MGWGGGMGWDGGLGWGGGMGRVGGGGLGSWEGAGEGERRIGKEVMRLPRYRKVDVEVMEPCESWMEGGRVK